MQLPNNALRTVYRSCHTGVQLVFAFLRHGSFQSTRSSSYCNSKFYTDLSQHSFRRWATSNADNTNPEQQLQNVSTTTDPCNGNPILHRRITYLTDVEGVREYLSRYVKQSKILHFIPMDPQYNNNMKKRQTIGLQELYFPYDHCIDFIPSVDPSIQQYLVYGGDVWDQGGSDLYVIRQLLHLKRRYPSNVFWVLGNRDTNKMRLAQEILPNPRTGLLPNMKDGVYWKRDPPDMMHLSNEADRAVARLQWLLRDTMGSPRAFRYRKEELQREHDDRSDPTIVNDFDVVKSYQESCHPDYGEMAQYLSYGQLAVRFGEVLFLHGSLPLTDPVLQHAMDRYGDQPHNVTQLWDDLTFAMPWLDPSKVTARQAGIHTIDDWICELNAFATRNIEQWRCHRRADSIQSQSPKQNGGTYWSQTGGYRISKYPFSDILQYGMGWTPCGTRNPTVIYSSWSYNGMPRRFFPSYVKDAVLTPSSWTEVGSTIQSSKLVDVTAKDLDEAFIACTREFFERSGIRLICSGHQPQGDMPNPIRIDPITTTTTPVHNMINNMQEQDEYNNQTRSCWILCCDTSYSGDTKWFDPQQCTLTKDMITLKRTNLGRGNSKSGRGLVAVTETLIDQCITTGKIIQVICHGVLSDGTTYQSHNLMDDAGQAGNGTWPVVGQIAVGNGIPAPEDSPHGGPWWTRAKMIDGTYLLTAGEGFNVWNLPVRFP